MPPPKPRPSAARVVSSPRGVATYPPGATFGPRAMRDYEFVWLIAGDAEYRVDSVAHAAPQGSIVLCRRGTVDEFVWDRHRRTQHGYVHFNIDAPLMSRLPAPDRWPIVVAAEPGDVLEALFRFTLGRPPEATGQIARAIDLMLDVFVNGPRVEVGLAFDIQPDPVARATAHLYELLNDDPATTITLDMLAAAACVTPEHLCRLFKKATGRSPMAAARLARLDRAATLLTRTNFSVGQIAEMCGFASQFHFARRFKTAFGGTPSETRRNVRRGGIPPTSRLLDHGKTLPDQIQA